MEKTFEQNTYVLQEDEELGSVKIADDVVAMIVGIPNVGKSTFINSFAGKACAKTGDKLEKRNGRYLVCNERKRIYI